MQHFIVKLQPLTGCILIGDVPSVPQVIGRGLDISLRQPAGPHIRQFGVPFAEEGKFHMVVVPHLRYVGAPDRAGPHGGAGGIQTPQGKGTQQRQAGGGQKALPPGTAVPFGPVEGVGQQSGHPTLPLRRPDQLRPALQGEGPALRGRLQEGGAEHWVKIMFCHNRIPPPSAAGSAWPAPGRCGC